METKEQLIAAKKALAKALKEGKPKGVSEKTDFLNSLKSDIMALVAKGFSTNQIHQILKKDCGFLGSYQTVRAVVAEWKEEAGAKQKTKNVAAGAAQKEEVKKPTAKAAKAESQGEKQDAYDKELDI